MENRLSRWGVGPRIGAPSILYTLAAWAATKEWPGVFLIPLLPDFARVVGVILLIAGLLVWASGVITVMLAYNRDELVATGIFALVRHPVYAGWITLGLPGLALIASSWPMLITPFMAYAIFKHFIHREDEYLQKRFGQAYLDYRRRVNAIIPIPRFWD